MYRVCEASDQRVFQPVMADVLLGAQHHETRISGVFLEHIDPCVCGRRVINDIERDISVRLAQHRPHGVCKKPLAVVVCENDTRMAAVPASKKWDEASTIDFETLRRPNRFIRQLRQP